jgi:hypothetical protein
VSITSAPVPPFTTEYPFTIDYASEDSKLFCVQFEVKQEIIGQGREIIKVSNQDENMHVLWEKPKELVADRMFQLSIRSVLGVKKSSWSEKVNGCSNETSDRKLTFVGHHHTISVGQKFVFEVRLPRI